MMSTHGWGAIKNPFCLGFQCPISVFCRFSPAFHPSMAGEPLKTLQLGAHATCTACQPHFNLSCRSLLAKQFIHSWGASKKPFLCCLLGDTQDLFRSFLCLCGKSSSRHT